MVSLAQHALLGLAACVLAGAGLRAATAAGAVGLERLIAAAPLAAAAAVVEALALGLVGLGTEPLALAAAAALSYAASTRWFPPSHAVTDLVRWWGGRSPTAKALTGGAAGAGAALCAWILLHPFGGVDGAGYHLFAGVQWIQHSQPGAPFEASYEFPVGSYPLSHEVLLAWTLAVSRGFAAATLWTPALLALAVAASWSGLRRLAVPAPAAGLATAALVTLPLLAGRLNDVNTDTPALAWLLCSGALVAGSMRQPRLLIFALVAAGMAVGTKTTVLPLSVALVALGVFAHRGDLRQLGKPLGLALAVAVVVGGTWYVRNVVEHGSPFWPFVTTPWGDGQPRIMQLLDHSLLERPEATLRGRIGDYASLLGGAIPLLIGAFAAPLLVRTRAVLGAAAVAALSLLLFSSAPVTGQGDSVLLDGLALTSVRYALPALAACAVTLALAARDGGMRGRAAVMACLGVAVAWSLVQDARLGFPQLPSMPTLALGALVGAGLACAASWGLSADRGRRAGPLRALTPALVAAVLGALLAMPASGYIKRHARTLGASQAPLTRLFSQPVTTFFSERSWFEEGAEPISFVRAASAFLAGDRLAHPLRFVARDENCERLREAGWLVVVSTVRAPVRGRASELFPPKGPEERCPTGRRPVLTRPGLAVYGPQDEGRRR